LAYCVSIRRQDFSARFNYWGPEGLFIGRIECEGFLAHLWLASVFNLPSSEKGGEKMKMSKKLALSIASVLIMVVISLGITLQGIRSLANPSPRPWLWVDKRGPPFFYASINDALAAALNGDVICVDNGTYHEHVLVNKSVTIQWNYISKPTIPPAIVDGSGTGVVFNVTASNVQIYNLTIRNAKRGISLFPTAINATVINNSVQLNSGYGVYVDSAGNTIKNNTLTNNIGSGAFGLYIDSAGNYLRNNNMTGNTYNFGISTFAGNNIDPSNIVNKNHPIYIFTSQSYRSVPPNAGYVAAVNSTRITVNNLNSALSNNDYGVRFVNTSYSSITNIRALNNMKDGIYIYKSNNVTVQNVSAFNNNHGIRAEFSNYNRMIDNVMANNSYGISLWYSNSSQIADNILSNGNVGFDLWSSIRNTVGGNFIQNNDAGGIQDVRGGGPGVQNLFYHNNMKNPHGRQVVYLNCIEKWDNGAEGNYWNDSRSLSPPWGNPNATELNGEGILNTYYKICDNNFDQYPLVNPWKSTRSYIVGQTQNGKFKGYTMTVHADHVIASMKFTMVDAESYPRQLTFNITAGSSGFVNVTVPRAWLDGPFTLSVDGVDRTGSLSAVQNSNWTSLYFTYASGIHQVKIIGTRSGTIPGDTDGNGFIDTKDLAKVAGEFGELLPSKLVTEIIEDP
jgi:parallel beta-helix repeat protein